MTNLFLYIWHDAGAGCIYDPTPDVGAGIFMTRRRRRITPSARTAQRRGPGPPAAGGGRTAPRPPAAPPASLGVSRATSSGRPRAARKPLGDAADARGNHRLRVLRPQACYRKVIRHWHQAGEKGAAGRGGRGCASGGRRKRPRRGV
jgi:hypothetical protein